MCYILCNSLPIGLESRFYTCNNDLMPYYTKTITNPYVQALCLPTNNYGVIKCTS